jgi:hypothetical protein
MLPWTCSRRIRHLQKQNRSVSTQPQNTPFLTRVQSGSLPGNYVPSFWQLLMRSRGPAQDHFASSLHHHRDHAAAFRYFKNIAPIIAIKIISWTSLNYSKPIFTHVLTLNLHESPYVLACQVMCAFSAWNCHLPPTTICSARGCNWIA